MKRIWIVTWSDGDDWYQVVTSDAAEVVRTLVTNPDADVHVGEWEIDSQGQCEMVGP